MSRPSDHISIVIADDHRSFGEALQVALDKERDLAVIEVVTDGEEAVRAAADADVVLLDMQMPGLDGVEAARRIREAGSEAAVIILTGFDDELALARALQAGAHGLLRKTEAVARLADSVRRAHRGEPLNAPDEVESSVQGLRRRRARDGDMLRRLERLTPRELEILQRMADGQSTERISEELGMSKHTLRTHAQNVLTKLGVHSKLDAIVAAIRHGKVRASSMVDLTGEESDDLDAVDS
jgi:DNA-binding NarL/FixJ family response regulator